MFRWVESMKLFWRARTSLRGDHDHGLMVTPQDLWRSCLSSYEVNLGPTTFAASIPIEAVSGRQVHFILSHRLHNDGIFLFPLGQSA